MSAVPSTLDAAHQVVLPARWRRLVVPSFSDLFFLSLIIWLFLTTPDGWSRLLLDGDTGWHIRAGEHVLDHGAVPRGDLFSFSKAAEPWFAWEWGADLLFALLHRAFGLKGIAWFAGALIALYAVVLFRFSLWLGANTLIALGATLVAVSASSIHYLARPHLFTLVLLPISVWMLERDRRNRWNGVWLLVPLAAVWTNLHGGFMALIAVSGLLAAGSLLATLLSPPGTRDWTASRRYAGLTAACSAATLLNPYGLDLHRHIAAYLQSDWIRNTIQEFQSPSFRNENILQFELLLLVGLMAAARLLARRRFAEALWILFWAHQSLGSVRHITVYATLAAPLVAIEATWLWDRFVDGAPRRSVSRILHTMASDVRANFRWTSAWPYLALALLLFLDKPIQWPRDFPSIKFPTGIIQRHAARIASGRVLTTDQWADYLIYRFYPQAKVYVDGRSDFYGPAIGNEYIRLSLGTYQWRQILERRRFDVALLPAEWSLATLLKEDPAWRLLEDDGKALLFVLDKGASRGGGKEFTQMPGKNRLTGLMKSDRASELPKGELITMKSEKEKPRSEAGSGAEPDAGADGGWRLPSGLQLAEFAIRGGFIAPGLLPKAPPSPAIAWKMPQPELREKSARSSRKASEPRSARSRDGQQEFAVPHRLGAKEVL